MPPSTLSPSPSHTEYATFSCVSLGLFYHGYQCFRAKFARDEEFSLIQRLPDNQLVGASGPSYTKVTELALK
jgi:hypothetical protein